MVANGCLSLWRPGGGGGTGPEFSFSTSSLFLFLQMASAFLHFAQVLKNCCPGISSGRTALHFDLEHIRCIVSIDIVQIVTRIITE